VISRKLAERLRDAGLGWQPTAGDRFVVPDRDMDDDVFVVSDMVVDVHDLPGGRVIGFNGTVEWALDSILAAEVVWLPREDQLRDRLGGAFVRLEAVPPGWVVVVRTRATEQRHADADVESAYARALLELLALQDG
jgi:hypothetical protein